MSQDESIISSYIRERRNECGICQESTIWVVEGVLISNICTVLGFELLYRTESKYFYIMVTGMTIKSSWTSCVLSMTTSLWLLEVNFVFFVEISICCMTIKWQIICLIGIMFFELSLFSCLTNELSFIRSRSIELSRIRSVLCVAMRFVNIDLVWNITLFICCFIIKFCSVWLVGIP